MLDNQKIKEIALANGFSLKEQASGNVDLHSYVYEFAQAVAARAIPDGFVLVPEQSLQAALLWMDDEVDCNHVNQDMIRALFEHKPVLEKAIIEAQEQLA